MSENIESKGKNDECYTPYYGVYPILKYIPENAVIWCPFDTKVSQFVLSIKKANRVIYSHLRANQDFYNYEPDSHWDMIISNPPFTRKRQIIERALSFNKPFALLMTTQIHRDKYPIHCWYEQDKQFQTLRFDKRIKYIGPNGESLGDKINFMSAYMCYNFLPKDFIIEELNLHPHIKTNRVI